MISPNQTTVLSVEINDLLLSLTLTPLSQIRHVSWLMLCPCSSTVFTWVCMQAVNPDFHNRLLASSLCHYLVSLAFHVPNTAIWLVAPDFWRYHTNTKSTQTFPGPLPFLKKGRSLGRGYSSTLLVLHASPSSPPLLLFCVLLYLSLYICTLHQLCSAIHSPDFTLVEDYITGLKTLL